jgi:hypothetical protein
VTWARRLAFDAMLKVLKEMLECVVGRCVLWRASIQWICLVTISKTDELNP